MFILTLKKKKIYCGASYFLLRRPSNTLILDMNRHIIMTALTAFCPLSAKLKTLQIFRKSSTPLSKIHLFFDIFFINWNLKQIWVGMSFWEFGKGLPALKYTPKQQTTPNYIKIRLQLAITYISKNWLWCS